MSTTVPNLPGPIGTAPRVTREDVLDAFVEATAALDRVAGLLALLLAEEDDS